MKLLLERRKLFNLNIWTNLLEVGLWNIEIDGGVYPSSFPLYSSAIKVLFVFILSWSRFESRWDCVKCLCPIKVYTLNRKVWGVPIFMFSLAASLDSRRLMDVRFLQRLSHTSKGTGSLAQHVILLKVTLKLPTIENVLIYTNWWMETFYNAPKFHTVSWTNLKKHPVTFE